MGAKLHGLDPAGSLAALLPYTVKQDTPVGTPRYDISLSQGLRPSPSEKVKVPKQEEPAAVGRDGLSIGRGNQQQTNSSDPCRMLLRDHVGSRPQGAGA